MLVWIERRNLEPVTHGWPPEGSLGRESIPASAQTSRGTSPNPDSTPPPEWRGYLCTRGAAVPACSIDSHVIKRCDTGLESGFYSFAVSPYSDQNEAVREAPLDRQARTCCGRAACGLNHWVDASYIVLMSLKEDGWNNVVGVNVLWRIVCGYCLQGLRSSGTSVVSDINDAWEIRSRINWISWTPFIRATATRSL